MTLTERLPEDELIEELLDNERLMTLLDAGATAGKESKSSSRSDLRSCGCFAGGFRLFDDVCFVIGAARVESLFIAADDCCRTGADGANDDEGGAGGGF